MNMFINMCTNICIWTYKWYMNKTRIWIKRRNYKNKPNRNFGAENYNSCIDIFTKGLKSILKQEAERIIKLERRVFEIIECKEQKGKKKDLRKINRAQEVIKWTNLWEFQKVKKGREVIWRNSGWKLPSFEEINGIYVEKAQWTSSKIKPKRYISRYIIKLLKEKDEEWMLETTREKWFIMYKGPSKDYVNYSAESSGMFYLVCWLGLGRGSLLKKTSISGKTVFHKWRGH